MVSPSQRPVVEYPFMNAPAPQVSEDAPRSRSLALVIAGSLMLLAAVLRANPWFGSANTAWPWQILLDSRSPLLTANWSLWLGSGLLAVVLGLWGTRRWRGALLGATALVLLFTCYSGLAGLMIESSSVSLLAGTSLLMAGFLLQTADRAAGADRALRATGALLVLWALACSFEYDAGVAPRAQLFGFGSDILARLTGGDVAVARVNYDDNLASYGALLLACALGLLGLVRLRGTLAGGLGLALVLLFFLIPPVANYFRALGQEGFDATTLAKHANQVLVPAGLALALLGAAVLADLARAADEERA
jgi:hypothetical protein